MYLSNTGLFRARWTEQIHDEWIRNLRRNNPDVDPERLERTKQLMNAHVPDCLIEGYEPLVDGLTLPDVDDRHVVAAAIKRASRVYHHLQFKRLPFRGT
nr:MULTISPECIES: hypothetical protein [unclassified Salinivibrio]